MRYYRTGFVGPLLLVLASVLLLSACILVPVDDGRGRSGNRGERGWERDYDHDRHDEYRR